MSDEFDVTSSVSAVLTEDEKPDDWDDMSLVEKLDYIREVVDGERV